ncbi:1 4-dihydroxy-2-naphthoate octaprenyltransferase [Prevotella sp. CAG:924]|nr:1 4-dihydroxy-2-naphthoate octaprenyltransferase [Prevotella sp. CAG:924]
MKETSITPNSLKAWVLAARPKTLTGAAVPVLIGTMLALADHQWQIGWLPCVLCFLFAFLMQIDANFVNDYFDWKRGNDDAATRLGPLRACSMGWVTPRAMQWALGVTTLVSCLVGLPLVIYGGWQMILVGLACVAFCYLYTLCLSYWGMGDLLVLVFFGLVPVALTYFLCVAPSPAGWSVELLARHFLHPVSLAAVPLHVWLMGLACGFAIDALLIINNYRDIENDRRDGKKTLVVRVGHRGGQLLYLIVGWVAIVLTIPYSLMLQTSHMAVVVVLLLVYLPFHYKAYFHMKTIDKGRELNRVLGETARNLLFFGLCVAAGLLIELAMSK